MKDPFIVEILNSLDPVFCHGVIAKFEQDADKGRGESASGADGVKKSTDLHITSKPDEWGAEDKVFFSALGQGLQAYSRAMTERFPTTPVSIYSGLDHMITDSGYQIQRTEVGEYFHWHSDNLFESGTSRVLAYIWYLNDVGVGGETEFINGAKVRPEQGKLVLFPTTWTYVHRGVSPVSGTKYICTGWVRVPVVFAR
jgi:hypothetical protein